MAARSRMQCSISVFSVAACAATLLMSLAFVPLLGVARADDLPYYLKDRGEGVSTSLFGTYVRKHELLVYTFYEYTSNKDEEYKPSELGFGGPRSSEDFLGKSVENEALVFVSYGITNRIELEIEPTYTSKKLTKARNDPSNMPQEIKESGLGDVDFQVRWKWMEEKENRPELFSFIELTPGFQKDRKIIGTDTLESSIGFGANKGFHFGTLTARAQFLYTSDQGGEFSEWAFEYLKRANKTWRFLAAIEGGQDEISAIVEAQVHFTSHCFLKVNSGFGLTPKAPDFAPEIGVVFSF